MFGANFHASASARKTLPLHSSRDGAISIFSRQLLHHVAFVFDGLPAGRFILSYSVSVVILHFKKKGKLLSCSQKEAEERAKTQGLIHP